MPAPFFFSPIHYYFLCNRCPQVLTAISSPSSFSSSPWPKRTEKEPQVASAAAKVGSWKRPSNDSSSSALSSDQQRDRRPGPWSLLVWSSGVLIASPSFPFLPPSLSRVFSVSSLCPRPLLRPPRSSFLPPPTFLIFRRSSKTFALGRPPLPLSARRRPLMRPPNYQEWRRGGEVGGWRVNFSGCGDDDLATARLRLQTVVLVTLFLPLSHKKSVGGRTDGNRPASCRPTGGGRGCQSKSRGVGKATTTKTTILLFSSFDSEPSSPHLFSFPAAGH